MTTLFSVAKRAKDTFERNIDTIVAAFLLRHPDVDPADVEMVIVPGADRALHFHLRKKGGVQLPSPMEGHDGKEFQDGFNAALEVVARINADPFGAMVSTVAQHQGIIDVEPARV